MPGPERRLIGEHLQRRLTSCFEQPTETVLPRPLESTLSLSIDKQVGLWSRVAGDGLDIATVMGGLRDDNPKRDNVAVALAMLLGVTLIDVVGAQSTTARHSRNRGERRLYQNRSGFPRGVQAARG